MNKNSQNFVPNKTESIHKSCGICNSENSYDLKITLIFPNEMVEIVLGTLTGNWTDHLFLMSFLLPTTLFLHGSPW